MNVAVLGASNKPHRYSYKAVKLLAEKGHTPFPVHPVVKNIEGIGVFKKLSEIPELMETISVYLSPANSDSIADEIINSGARRVIFNPGAENPNLADLLRDRGFEVVEACTLVLLKTGQF